MVSLVFVVRNVVVSLLMACLLFAYIVAGSLVCAFCRMNVYFYVVNFIINKYLLVY